MKKSKFLVSFSFIFLSLTLTGCFSSDDKKTDVEYKSDIEDPYTDPIDEDLKQVSLPLTVAIKNFNQINATFSAVTGIGIDDEDIVAEYDTIKSQLSSNNDVESLSSFGHLATTRLAFAYCDKALDNNDNFKDLDYSSMTDEAILAALFDQLLDSKPEEYEGFDGLKREALKIISNESNLVPSGNKKNLAKVTCSAILSSAYFTVII